MKFRIDHLIKAFLAALVLPALACLGAGGARAVASEIVLVGCTPGDPLIKSRLAINPGKKIDFIRWHLTLNQSDNHPKTYALKIAFGESEPNTPGFKNEERLSFEGTYTISKTEGGEIYELKNEKAPTAVLALLKLNDSNFHLLTSEQKLMVGNGGWSYTLNRKNPPETSSWFFSFRTAFLPETDAEPVIFAGRTPCLEFAARYDLQVAADCHKLKWKLTLFRDPGTDAPAEYLLQTTLNRFDPVRGKWTIIKGNKMNPEAIIYRLDPDQPGRSISFLVGDENVLFFLDPSQRLLTGNDDFSFTLNRASR